VDAKTLTFQSSINCAVQCGLRSHSTDEKVVCSNHAGCMAQLLVLQKAALG
jgi:hypothetical protein